MSVKVGLLRDKSSKPWLWMLATDFVIAVAGILYTLYICSPKFPGYMHLLVTYHFGFARRALVGTIVSWFTDTVPLWYVHAIAIATSAANAVSLALDHIARKFAGHATAHRNQAVLWTAL
jgi:hypothetical protein